MITISFYCLLYIILVISDRVTFSRQTVDLVRMISRGGILLLLQVAAVFSEHKNVVLIIADDFR